MVKALVASLGVTFITILLLVFAQGHNNEDSAVHSFQESDKHNVISAKTAGIPVVDSVPPAPSDRVCVVRYGNRRYRARCDDSNLPPSALPENATVLETDKFPSNTGLYPEIGNGHVATVVTGDSIFMNGLYNGKNVDSHRARIPSTVAVGMVAPSKVTKKYVLDLGRGMYYERHTGEGFYIELRMYAHRVVTTALVVEVIIEETSAGRKEDIQVELYVNNGSRSDDITWTIVEDNDVVTVKSGHTRDAEYPSRATVTPVTIYSTNIPTSLTLPVGTSKENTFFVTSISNVNTKAIDGWKQVMDLVANGTVLSSHVAEWAGLWGRGRIDVEGNLTMARVNYASLYYLTSSLPLKEDPSWPFVGLSPGGLAHGQRNMDYDGHVFWDQDTWMFPPILMLHADLGRTIVGTRIRTLDAAKAHASSTHYKGARYPWESAFTGLETSPSKECGDYEQHIIGDVSLAFRQYLQMTNDTDFLTNARGLEAVTAIADFWASRVLLNNKTKMWEIMSVMPPDEYESRIDNSAYTNTVARLSLLTGIDAMTMAGRKPPSNWGVIADNIYIPFDEKRQYHPEFDGYKYGTTVKQADVVMLGFPLMFKFSDEQVQKNDLLIYQKVTPGGPAMTWGIFAINWLALGVKDKADKLFKQTSLNAKEPFYVWTENADGTGAVNFHTGMGGYLQAVIFGYGGFRIGKTQLEFNPTLPPSTTRLSITGLDYGGNSLDLTVDASKMTITATSLSSPMAVKLLSSGATDSLSLNQPRTYPRQKAALFLKK